MPDSRHVARQASGGESTASQLVHDRKGIQPVLAALEVDRAGLFLDFPAIVQELQVAGYAEELGGGVRAFSRGK